MDYSGIALSIWIHCLVPMKLSACLLASGLMVPISVATKEIHCSIYIASYVVGHNVPESPRANKVLPHPKDPFLYTKHLGEIVQGF